MSRETRIRIMRPGRKGMIRLAVLQRKKETAETAEMGTIFVGIERETGNARARGKIL